MRFFPPFLTPGAFADVLVNWSLSGIANDLEALKAAGFETALSLNVGMSPGKSICRIGHAPAMKPPYPAPHGRTAHFAVHKMHSESSRRHWRSVIDSSIEGEPGC